MDLDAMPKVMGDDGEFHAVDEVVDLSHTTTEGWAALALFWLLGATVFYQFFTRYALNDSLAWTEEIARYLLICVGFLGGGLAFEELSSIGQATPARGLVSGSIAIPLEPGFTVVTGPNGSGKSNILDAVLFCLGLASSRGMRAERLPDLINSGLLRAGKDFDEGCRRAGEEAVIDRGVWMIGTGQQVRVGAVHAPAMLGKDIGDGLPVRDLRNVHPTVSPLSITIWVPVIWREPSMMRRSVPTTPLLHRRVTSLPPST